MRFSRLRDRLFWLFFSFFLLVTVSAAVTFWALDAQRQDALLVNLAGRQRMLVQQMARVALDVSRSDAVVAPLALQDARALFAQTLAALRYGGEAIDGAGERSPIRPVRDPQIAGQLERVALTWRDFGAELDRLLLSSPGSAERLAAAAAIDRQSARLLAEADGAVRLYQESATRHVNRLRVLQAAFLVGALLLLVVGGWLVRHSMLAPLQRLDQAAERIGANDLSTPVEVAGPQEITLLSGTLESMRARLQTSRDQLLQMTADLEDRVAQRTRELNALNEVSREIASQLDVRQVLNSVTEKAAALLDGDAAMLCLLDETGRYLRLEAATGVTAVAANAERMSTAGLASAVLASRRALVCSPTHCIGGCALFTNVHAVSHVVAPLRIGENVIGALCVSRSRPNRFVGEEPEIVTKLANTAAVALQNAQLYAQAERAAALEERNRIAADMHDGLGQTLSYLGLVTDQTADLLVAGQNAAALTHLERMRQTIGRTTQQVRKMIEHLLDGAPSEPNLSDLMHETVYEIAEKYRVEVQWRGEDGVGGVSRPVAEQILNITREALENACRHAQAQAICVHHGREDGHGFVRIEDDGCGFDPAGPGAEPPGHFGMQVMKVRAAHINGECTIESTPGAGTRVTLTYPHEVVTR